MISWLVQVHVFQDNHIKVGMEMLEMGLPMDVVDQIVLKLGHIMFGDLSEYGITRPTRGPFYLKSTTGRSAIIDVGTIDKIKAQEIKV